MALCALGLVACASAPDNVWDDREPVDDGSESSDDAPERDAASDKDAGKRDAGKASTGSSSSSSSGASGSGSSSKDAGKSASTGSSSIISITQGDASVSTPLDAITDLLGGLSGGSSGDGGTQPRPTNSDGGIDHCAELVCFDVFDCALWHGDALDCGFTKCEGFVCAK